MDVILTVIALIAIVAYLSSFHPHRWIKIAVWGTIVVAALYLASVVGRAMVGIDYPKIIQLIAYFMSGYILLDGFTIFATGLALGSIGMRLMFLIQYRWFFKDGTGMNDKKFHELGIKRFFRWSAFYFAFLMWSMQLATFLARLPKN